MPQGNQIISCNRKQNARKGLTSHVVRRWGDRFHTLNRRYPFSWWQWEILCICCLSLEELFPAAINNHANIKKRKKENPKAKIVLTHLAQVILRKLNQRVSYRLAVCFSPMWEHMFPVRSCEENLQLKSLHLHVFHIRNYSSVHPLIPCFSSGILSLMVLSLTHVVLSRKSFLTFFFPY